MAITTKADARRRWFGMLFLGLAAALLIWGQTLLKPHLQGGWFILYWGVCSLLTLLAMATALLDMLILRRRARDEHRDLIQRSFGEPKDEPAERASNSGSRSNEKNSQS
jgi:uncharacterized membrane protein YhaH (DUF805 family)